MDTPKPEKREGRGPKDAAEFDAMTDGEFDVWWDANVPDATVEGEVEILVFDDGENPWGGHEVGQSLAEGISMTPDERRVLDEVAAYEGGGPEARAWIESHVELILSAGEDDG